jgi:hypothetical protein
MVGIGSIWLGIGTGGGLMWPRWWTFEFHKVLGSSRVAAQLEASQGLSSMSEWVLQVRTLRSSQRVVDCALNTLFHLHCVCLRELHRYSERMRGAIQITFPYGFRRLINVAKEDIRANSGTSCASSSSVAHINYNWPVIYAPLDWR